MHPKGISVRVYAAPGLSQTMKRNPPDYVISAVLTLLLQRLNFLAQTTWSSMVYDIIK